MVLQTMTQFIYCGASTATKSYEDHEGTDELSKSINLGKLFSQYTGYTCLDESGFGYPNTMLIDIVKKHYNTNIPVFWVYADPIGGVLYENGSRTFPELPKDQTKRDLLYRLITADDWKAVYYEIADAELAYLNSTGFRIGFVGSSADIHPWQVEKYENLTVVDSSWKRVLSDDAGIKYPDPYLLPEVVHPLINMFFPQKIDDWRHVWQNDRDDLYDNPHLNQDLVDKIYQTYEFRRKIEEHGTMVGVHPNVRGNMLYHEHVKKGMKEFIDSGVEDKDNNILDTHMSPVYGDRERRAVSTYLGSGGRIMEHTATRHMEELICTSTGAKHAHMVPSATMGLLLCSMLSEIKPGEEFDVSAYTQAATANGAILMGATPNIIDVDKQTYTIDFDKVSNRVVFVSSINGRAPADYEQKITQLRESGHFVIEDAAQAFGSHTVQGNQIGTLGDVGVFSFGAPKIITTGQGGCIVTDNHELSERIHAIKNFGRTVGVGEVYNVMGLNFKFTDLQASFGVEQMLSLGDIVDHKKYIFEQYYNNLKDSIEFVNTDLLYTTPTYPEILVDRRDELSTHLTSLGIGNRAVYSSLSRQPFHSKWATDTPVTDYIGDRGLQLPGQSNLTKSDIDIVCQVIRDFYKL